MPLRDLQRLLLIFWGLFPSHTQKINYSIRCEISKPQQDVRAAAEARRRCEGVWNHHPWWVQVFSVYDFINLVCQKNDAYSWQVWKRISENSKFKDGIEFKMEILTDQSGELSLKGETRTRQTQTWPSCQCKNQLALRIVTGGYTSRAYVDAVQVAVSLFHWSYSKLARSIPRDFLRILLVYSHLV